MFQLPNSKYFKLMDYFMANIVVALNPFLRPTFSQHGCLPISLALSTWQREPSKRRVCFDLRAISPLRDSLERSSQRSELNAARGGRAARAAAAALVWRGDAAQGESTKPPWACFVACSSQAQLVIHSNTLIWDRIAQISIYNWWTQIQSSTIAGHKIEFS